MAPPYSTFNLYYISCTYVKPMNCMVLGNKQYLQEPLPGGIIKLTILVDQIYHVSSWSPLWIRLA